MAPLGLGWPNLISASRIALVPVLVILVLIERRWASYAAVAVTVHSVLDYFLRAGALRRAP